MPTGFAARITDPVMHVLPPVLTGGPPAKVLIGMMPAWKGIPLAAGPALLATSTATESTLQTLETIAKVAEAAALAAAGTPAAPAAVAAATAARLAAETAKAAAAAANAASITAAAATGASVHACTLPWPLPPHGPGVVIDGSATVMIENSPACRMGDTIIEAIGPPNKIMMGCPTVIIGDNGAAGAGLGAALAAAAVSGAAAKCEDAPTEVVLPKNVVDAMHEAYKNSFPGGKSQEQGATLVMDSKGNVNVVNKVGGTSGTCLPDRTVGAGDTIIGTFHTHPYDASEGSYKGVSFSGADIAYAANYKEPIYVDAGDKQFMIMPTAKTTANRATLNAQWNTEYAKELAAGKSVPDASAAATNTVAKKNGMAYYEGKDGVLKRVSC